MNIDENKKERFREFRKWLVIQKYTLQRGYGWLNVLMLGVVCAASIKTVLPWLITTIWRFIGLVILGFIGLYIVGWIDYRFRFLHDEQNYATTTNPILMEGLKGGLKRE